MFSAAVNAAVLTTLVIGRQCWTQGHHSTGHVKVKVKVKVKVITQGQGIYYYHSAMNAAVLTTLVIGRQCWTQGHHSTALLKVKVKVITQGHHSKTVYRCLFSNLAVADCLSSVSMWLGNNLAYLFGDQLASMNICLSIISLSAAFFISSAFCLAAMMTVLGFAVVQYFSICHPLQNMTIVSTKKVYSLAFYSIQRHIA